MLQNIFPTKVIHRAMACRGTDRTMAPPPGMHPQEAPYVTRTGDTHYETFWEKWTDLAKRQLIRPSHSCRINVTVFARDKGDADEGNDQSNSLKEDHVSPPTAGNQTDQFEAPMHEPPEARLPEVPEVVSSDQPRGHSDEMKAKPSNSQGSDQPEGPTSTEVDRTKPDHFPKPRAPSSSETSASQQGFRFQSLPKWEQQTILRMHKSSGHPSNDRLAKALQVNGARPEVVQAALEIRCATCSATSPPKHA